MTSPEASIRAMERRFAAIPVKVREAVRYAMADQADKLVEEMFNLAPKDTYELVSSIGWTWGDAPAGTMAIGTVGGPGGTEYGSMKITIFAGGGDAFHARFQEFGTVDMAANPFFYPVWRLRRRRVRSAISRAMRKAIREAMAA